MDEEILGSVLRGIKPKDYTPIQVRQTPEFGGIQLTEEQQAKKDNMESVKNGEILPLGGFADTVEAQWESAKDLVKSTDVYKNLFGNSAPDDNRLEQSEKLGSALGIAPQLIASDPDMYKAAVTTYERQRNAAALNNQPFSAKTLNELYPELDTEDPVATTIALKDYTNILKNREAAAQGAAVYTMPESKLTDLSNVIGYLYDTGTRFVGTAYEAGQALDAQSELMYKASVGAISDEEVEKAIPDLMNVQKAYNAEIGDSYVAKIVGETISQLSMQKNMIMRGAAEILSPIAPLAQPILAATKTNLPQIATLGAASAASAVGATGAVAGAAVTGAAALTGLIALGTASVFVGTYRAEAGQAYWDWRAKKDKNGKSVYTRDEAIGHAKRVGVINAAIEAGAMELALKGITKVWGSDAAKAVIKNEAAMKKLIGAGRNTVRAKAIGYGAKQLVKVAAPEIAEEGLQSLSADIDTNLFGKETVSIREMTGNALDAMIEAVPSVIGMSIGGAALAGAGAHRAMKRIAGLSEMKDAVIEFKRENERSMLQKLMDLRSESSLYKKAPETYQKTLQNQLDRTGFGTLYIDASAAAENEKTHDALNKLVEDGTITAKELDDAIKTGKPLEVETGKYMQTATPETHDALSDYTTMDKGEKTIHAIREERQRMKDMIDIVTMTREKREAAASEKILNDHFSEDTDIGREDRDTAREILSGGLDHIEDTCKTILQEAKDAWGELTGVKELQDYMERRKTQDANFSNEKGVDFVDVGEGKDRVHLRISKNPGWYQDFYDSYGRAPTQRELYDIAQEKIIAENDKGDDESKAAIAEIEEAKKRVESIERVSETLKSLNKEDLIAQTLLDPETYEEAYKPLLAQIQAAGNGAVTKAARDSALVLAKLAENFHKNYGVPLKLAMIAAGEVSPETAHQLNQSAIENELQLAKEKYWNTDEWMKAPDGTPTKLTERQWLIAHSDSFKKWFGGWDTVEKINGLINGARVELAEKEMQHFQEMDSKTAKEEAKDVFRKLFSTVKNNTGYPEPAVVKRKDGEEIVVPMSALKEIRRHSADRRVLAAVSRLPDIIRDSTFLFESEKDLKRSKRLNQTTTGYRYYGIKVGNKPGQYIRIVVRTDENGKHYLYDMDFNGAGNNKKSPHQTMLLDPKNESQSDKSFFTHSIQEWLAKVKETTDKIGENGEVLPSVVNDFEGSSTYHQMAGEHTHNVPSDKLTKKGMAERQLDADEKSFADSVDRFIAGKEKSPMVRVMTTPLVLELTGAEVLPVEIAKTDLEKILNGKHAGDMTPEIMKQLPRALTNPIMIFKSYAGPNGEERRVVVVDLKDNNGATIVVPFELKATNTERRYIVNRITSVYGKTGKKTRAPSYEWFGRQLENESLLYANRKKAINEILRRSPNWPIPEEKVNSLLSAPNVANEEDLVKLKNENPTYYQTAAEKDLVVYHNVSTGKLREAIKLGGLPMPSLAITKRDIPFGDFGEITLIGSKDMIDPRKSRANEVFSRDAYTVRKPVINYEEPAERDQKAFHEKFQKASDELKRKGVEVRKINFPSYTGEEALARMENDEVIKYYYVKNVLKKDVPVKYGMIAHNYPHKEFFEKYPDILIALKDPKVKEKYFSDLDKACQPYIEDLKEKIRNKKGLLALNKRSLAWLQKDGHVSPEAVITLSEWAGEYEKGRKASSKKIVDKSSFDQDLQKTIEEEGIDKFISFVRSEFDNLYKERYLWDNGKKYAFNIDNIVKLMKRYRGTNNEGAGGINYGFNSLLAFLSKKFTSVRDIKNRESSLASNKKELTQYKKAEAMYNRLIDEAAELRGGYGMDLDMNLAELMKDTRDGKKDLHGFPEDKKFMQRVKDFLKEADKVTTDYFEAKPARKVTFDEFSGAVIPKDTPKETVDFLKAQGIEVAEYDPDVEGDRGAKTKELGQLLNVYFQNKYQGSYDRSTNVIELFDGANESTVIHEGAHMFLSMLENMSQMSEGDIAAYFNGDAGKARTALKSMQGDLSTIRSWAAFSDDHLSEYKGTVLEKEFTKYAEDIRAGKAGAMERWMQERFARGFEKYLMEGSAPTKEMQGVFRRFKKWLTDIYKTAKSLGNVELTPEIKDIFDRMISTEDEINAWAAQRKLEAIDKTIDVNQSELGNLKAWAESVKDKALEKAMSYYLHMVKEEAIEKFRASISSEEEHMKFLQSLGEENEIYQIESIYNSDTFPTKKDQEEFLKMAGLTEKELKEKLRAAGGTTEERWSKHIEEMMQHYREEALTPEAIRGMAEEILRSPEGMARKSRIEAMLLEKKVSAYIHLVTSMQLELKRSKDKKKTAREIRKLYTVGLDERGKPVSYTKEQLLAMALNFGTKSNRERLIETLWLSDTLNTDEKTILDMLDKNLTDKDWDFVEKVWEHLNSYWGERNKVQNDLYGTPLGKVQGEDFTLKSGRVIHGQYYRIKYDPLSSTKTSNFSTTDIAKMDMQNISSFSLGMGSTKQRAGTSGGQKLRLDLDVYVEAVNEAMQHIAMREATVDVYKLLNRKEVVTAIENTAGPETLSLLQGWAKDCWHSSIKDMSEWDSTLGRARRRFNFTTMGFRFSTALLNIGNITGMMERMGAANALKAVGDFYFHGNIVEQRRFIQTKSTMMRDRGATIDRDMYMQDRLPVGKNESELRSKIEHGKYGVDTLNAKAYWLIQATDEMFSLPEWLYTYKNAMAVMEVDGKLTREEMDAEAVRLADKAVRETFGSNETKDQTSFIRKNGILAQMTTFYSYTNLVTNQFIRAGYILYDKGDVKPLLAATWYWWILGALVETALREIGDDSDDEDKWKKKFLHVIASGGPIGGVPLAREALPWTVDFFVGKSFGSAAPDAPFFDMLKHMENFLKAAKKGDLIEMGRSATKAITRTSIPVPDTITDAFWNFMRMACTDTEFTIWDWFRKSLWDKTLKEKKK